MKKAISAILAIVLILGIAACDSGGNGGNGSDDPNQGVWIAYTVDLMGMVVEVDEVFSSGATIELKRNGNCTITFDNESEDAKWTLSGNALTIEDGSDSITGTIEGNILTLVVEDGLMTITYYKEGTDRPQGGSSISNIFDNLLGNDDEPDDEPEVSEEPDIGIEIPTIPPVEEIEIDLRNVDMWIGYLMVTGGREYSIEQAYANGAWIDLKDTGDATLAFDGNPVEYKWQQVGRNVTFSVGSLEYAATIVGDVLEFNLTDDIVLVFGREGTIDFSETEPDEEDSNGDEPSGDITMGSGLAWWDGHWYGTFYIYEGNEPYEELEGLYWDLYCVIETKPNNTAVVYLWSMELELGTVEIEIDLSGRSVMGTAMSLSGVLFDESVKRGDWTINPAQCQYDNMIEVREIYVDEDGDWFDYEILLRPWGMDWDDVDEIDQPQYYNWYLSQMDNPMFQVIVGLSEYIHSAFADEYYQD